MAPSSTIVPKGGLVLVTGANGFVGSHVAGALLKQGYQVRGTVRTQEKAKWLKEALLRDYPSGKVELVIVPDSTAPGAWDDVVPGVDGIVHVAGDMTFDCDPTKVIPPQIASIKNLLAVAANEETVKRVVLTSSNRAAYPPVLDKEYPVDQTMYNEDQVKKAWAPAPYEPDRTWDVYGALKTQTEQEFYAWARDHKPAFVVNSVLPCFTIGPIISPHQPGSTGKWVQDFWKDEKNFAPLQGFGASWYIDSEDVALLHVAGLSEEDVKNERLFGFGGAFNFNDWLKVFRELDPKRTWPQDDPKQSHDLTKFDPKREHELLKRFGRNGWTPFAESVRRNVQESHLS